MASGIDPKRDYVFKRLFGDEDNALLLVDLLNAVCRLPPGQLVSGVGLLNPFVEKDYEESKVSVLDVRARDDPGRQYLLEMQQFVRPAMDKRLLYYWAGAHAQQLLKGDRYEMLHPTYTICLLNEPLIDDAFYHHCFGLYDKEHDVSLGKDLQMHLLELSKFNVPVEEVRTPLERWCYFFKHGASLERDKLPAMLDVPVIRKAVEVLMKISQSEREREWMLERERVERDARDLAATARAAQEDLRAALEARQAALEKLRGAEEEGRRPTNKASRKGNSSAASACCSKCSNKRKHPGTRWRDRARRNCGAWRRP